MIGDEMRFLRDLAGMSVEQAARETGLAATFIESMEAGQTAFYLPAIHILSKSYGRRIARMA